MKICYILANSELSNFTSPCCFGPLMWQILWDLFRSLKTNNSIKTSIALQRTNHIAIVLTLSVDAETC